MKSRQVAMMLYRRLVQTAESLFRLPALRHRSFRVAGQRGASFVLVYHRVGPHGPSAHEIVPTLSSDRFEQQVRALTRIGDVVSLSDILEPPRSYDRPRFAITFDDDHVCHVRHVLPILSRVGVTATFFLSGRVLHGLPPYWWSFVEESLRTEGLARTRERLGASGDTVAELAAGLEGTPLCRDLENLLPAPPEPLMPVDDMRTLARAGMTIGFHTLHHDMLTRVPNVALDTAVSHGREELADAIGERIDLLAFPYGRTNARVSEAARMLGFRAAFATGGLPNSHHSDRFALGRWDPEQLSGDAFVRAVALRVLRRQTPPGETSPVVSVSRSAVSLQ